MFLYIFSMWKKNEFQFFFFLFFFFLRNKLIAKYTHILITLFHLVLVNLTIKISYLHGNISI